MSACRMKSNLREGHALGLVAKPKAVRTRGILRKIGGRDPRRPRDWRGGHSRGILST